MGKLFEMYEGDNVGGIATLQIAHVTDFKSFNPVVFHPGKAWREIELYPDSGLMKSDVQHGDNGTSYSYAGSFKIHHQNKKIENILDKYIGPVSVMRVTDMNRYAQVIGSPLEPVTLSRSADTGSKPTDLNHNQFSFTVAQLNAALS
ncbi:hypothetical protein FAZ19_19750 [Sphingobacterium alkalisoli]|uniref:Phage tail protein n=1 Tax=Sphingobacterium alkalisoli TaxID=1874115 RepID=A0A4U0GUF3_9SPHI|nr:hypothetical protein [Sphingobacterium alkalisoli]TJY62705.1 hypothetical protein FAZ19_19750 [Sphingobacterium alkalisoli]GGH28329.1 hypothetical protein GCM10011418_38910 [Sphingobacterium alkalisoli]